MKSFHSGYSDQEVRMKILSILKFPALMSFKMSWRKRHSYEQVQFYALLLSSPGVCAEEFCQALDQLLILGWYNPTYLLQVQIIHLESQKAEQPEKNIDN